jgi:putative ABC transport system permease protein
MRRAPGFSLLSVLTLALGIGLTTATFTLVNGVLLRPLALQRPAELVALFSRDSIGHDIPVVSAGNWNDWREQATSLQSTALHMPRSMAVGAADGAIRVPGEIVTAKFFETLQPQFLLGRPFSDDELLAHEPVVVVSEGLWRQLGGDSTLSRAVRIDGVEHRMVGVVRGGTEYPAGTSIWGPVQPGPEFGAMRNNIGWSAVARLKPGVSSAVAAQDLGRIADDIRSRIPEALYSYGVGVVPLQQYVVGDAGEMLRLLMLAVAAVLLIACANLAAANLGKGAARSREFAMRIALGAGRARLIQQILIEQLVLALAGGVVGSWLAWASVHAVTTRWGAEIPRAAGVDFDLRVLLFALGVSILAGVLAGIAPALRGSDARPQGLMSGDRTASGGSGLPGAWLIGGEIAIALVLLTGAGLLLRSFQRLLDRELGYQVQVATVEAGLPRARFETPDRAAQFWDHALVELQALPGVTAAGAANWIPFGGDGGTFLEVAGRSGPNGGARYRAVGGDYFAALGVPLLAGRVIGSADAPGAPRVVVINQRMADLYWPGENPLGRQVRAVSMEPPVGGVPTAWLTVVGVVGNVRHWGLESDLSPEMYVAYRQVPQWAYGLTAVVRGSGRAEGLLTSISARMRQLDPDVAVVVGTLEERMDRSLANRRFVMTVLSGFSLFALVLAAIGLYAVLSYAVSRRTRELAVRSALGATRRQLLALVWRGALRVVLAGMIAGLGGALLLSRSLASFLVDITPFDPTAFAFAAMVLLLISAFATLIPALRATRSDPLIALQQD